MVGRSKKSPASSKGRAIQWDGTIGPASVIGLVGTISVIVSMGVMWGSTTTKLESTQASVHTLSQSSAHKDGLIAAQGERLGRVETSVGFIVPAIQRIEAAIAK